MVMLDSNNSNGDTMSERDVTGEDLKGIEVGLDKPTVLYRSGVHAIYWLGVDEATAFRCNAYLIKNGDEAILVDPGSRSHFGQIKDRVAQVLPPGEVTGMILCHQDPDVAASMVDWIDHVPDIKVFTTPRTQVLLPHYGRKDYNYYDVAEFTAYRLPSGSSLRFVAAPFLHFPGAFAVYDDCSRYLLSGDIWAALDLEWKLVVDDFDEHIAALDLFHRDYMASNLAARGFVRNLEGLKIDAILPQHGSIIGPGDVSLAIDYLRNLRCGTDIIYAGLQ